MFEVLNNNENNLKELNSIFSFKKRDKIKEENYEEISSSLDDYTYENVDLEKLKEFLEKIEEKLASLSNQDVARILGALIEKGLLIEDDEDLEYWINRLEFEAMNRVDMYLSQNYVITTNKDGNIKFERHRERKTKRAKDYNLYDVDAFVNMVGSIKKVERRRNPLSREYDLNNQRDVDGYSKFIELEKKYSEIEKVLKKDLTEKRKEESSKEIENYQTVKSQEIDYSKMLKSKMENAGVVTGGAYWNDVVSDFSMSSDRESFAKNWSADVSIISAEKAAIAEKKEKSADLKDKEKISELRGIDEKSADYEKNAESDGNNKSKSLSKEGKSSSSKTRSMSSGRGGGGR